MNPLLTAKTYAIGAHDILLNHGLGRERYVCQAIRNARMLVSKTRDDMHQADWLSFELAAALNAVHERDPDAAMHSLECVIGALELLIQTEDKRTVDRLIESVYPWRGR